MNIKKTKILKVLSMSAMLTTLITSTVAHAESIEEKRGYEPLTINEGDTEKIDKADFVAKETVYNYNKAKDLFKITDLEKKEEEKNKKKHRRENTEGRFTQKEIRDWALSRHNKAVDVDGAFGAQCVDLIMAMYNKFGAYRVGGNAIDYASNHLPNGWTRYKKGEVSVKPGDILVWKWSPYDVYGHVDIVISVKGDKIQTIGQNVGTDGSGGPARIMSRTDANLVAIIRPPFVEYDDELEDYADDWQKDDLIGGSSYTPTISTGRQTYIAPTYDNPETKTSSNNQTEEIKEQIRKHKETLSKQQLDIKETVKKETTVDINKDKKTDNKNIVNNDNKRYPDKIEKEFVEIPRKTEKVVEFKPTTEKLPKETTNVVNKETTVNNKETQNN